MQRTIFSFAFEESDLCCSGLGYDECSLFFGTSVREYRQGARILAMLKQNKQISGHKLVSMFSKFISVYSKSIMIQSVQVSLALRDTNSHFAAKDCCDLIQLLMRAGPIKPDGCPLNGQHCLA
jgi:hypothetical protein